MTFKSLYHEQFHSYNHIILLACLYHIFRWSLLCSSVMIPTPFWFLSCPKHHNLYFRFFTYYNPFCLNRRTHVHNINQLLKSFTQAMNISNFTFNLKLLVSFNSYACSFDITLGQCGMLLLDDDPSSLCVLFTKPRPKKCTD